MYDPSNILTWIVANVEGMRLSQADRHDRRFGILALAYVLL